MILFASVGWISSVSALQQQQQQTQLGVRITEPVRGQQLAIGKNLTIAGTSSDSSTSNCGVYVIVNGIKPYQKTIPIGQAGGNDYSKWKYTRTPAYVGTIKEGVNRITAKLVCQASPVNLTKFYSINVTGMNGIIPKQPSAIASNNTAAVPVSSNSISYLYHLAPLVNQLPAGHKHTISTSTSSSTSSDSSGDSGHHHHSTGKNHVKSRTSRHGIYEGGGSFNGGPGGSFNGGPGGPGGGFNGGPGGPGGGFNGGPGGPGGSFNGGYDSDNPFGPGY
ncbi:MAG: hypothetical protein WB988_03795 [Candidatus Nitrosopolaris sp.]